MPTHPRRSVPSPTDTGAGEGPDPSGPDAVVRLVRDGPVPVASCSHCGSRLRLATVGNRWTVRRPCDVADRLTIQLGTLEREELHVLVLNARNVVLDQERLYVGNVSAAVVRVAELFRNAVSRHASRLILCHNHPSGDLEPSPDDLRLTAEAIAAGRLLDIEVLDHLIVGGGSYVSLRDAGVPFAARATGRTPLQVPRGYGR